LAWTLVCAFPFTLHNSNYFKVHFALSHHLPREGRKSRLEFSKDEYYPIYLKYLNAVKRYEADEPQQCREMQKRFWDNGRYVSGFTYLIEANFFCRILAKIPEDKTDGSLTISSTNDVADEVAALLAAEANNNLVSGASTAGMSMGNPPTAPASAFPSGSAFAGQFDGSNLSLTSNLYALSLTPHIPNLSQFSPLDSHSIQTPMSNVYVNMLP
jgi:hypothetical protein